MPLGQIREELDRIRHPFRIAIRRSKNAFNVGAIIRTAHSFLAREIILIGDEPWYERAAMGMQRYEHVVKMASEAELIERARQAGWPLCVLEKDHDRLVSLWDAALPE